MSDVVLPRGDLSADTYYKALKNLVDRYHNENDQVHYKQAAVDLGESTVSSCLKFFFELEIIERPKRGYYIPKEFVIDYYRKVGNAKSQAKKELHSAFDDYKIYSEMKFLLGRDDYQTEELSEQIAGQVGADKEEVSKISKAIAIFSKYEIVQIDDEGVVSLVESSTQKESGEDIEESEGSDVPSAGSAKDQSRQSNMHDTRTVRDAQLNAEFEISIDITEMDPDEIEEKITAVRNASEDAE